MNFAKIWKQKRYSDTMENFHNKFAKFDPADSCYASYTIAQQGWLDSASDDALMIDCLMFLQGCGIEKWDQNTLN